MAETLAEMVPSTKALGVIVSLAATAFMAGVGFVLGFGEYARLPEDVITLQVQTDRTDDALATLRIEFDESVVEAARERGQILCEEVLSPVEVNRRCP